MGNYKTQFGSELAQSSLCDGLELTLGMEINLESAYVRVSWNLYEETDTSSAQTQTRSAGIERREHNPTVVRGRSRFKGGGREVKTTARSCVNLGIAYCSTLSKSVVHSTNWYTSTAWMWDPSRGVSKIGHGTSWDLSGGASLVAAPSAKAHRCSYTHHRTVTAGFTFRICS
ncbi:hypothetical protein K438DRAFT_1787714 [Mycena galopus ATCC 62051]|nr:hypothetical protein K438DRAFT_1787714 [Mycena galopus ATCC 62051]